MEGDLHTFKKLAIKRFPRVGEQRSGEESFWKKLQVRTRSNPTALCSIISFISSFFLSFFLFCFFLVWQFPVVVKEFAPVTSLHFSASPPHDFAVTSGARVGTRDALLSK